MGNSPSFITFPERLHPPTEPFQNLRWQLLCSLRVAMPGIVYAFDAEKQTVKVQPAIMENVIQNQVPTAVTLPLLEDVPIVVPRAGGVGLTLPIQIGDECLVVFADMCIDDWWQAGGIRTQLERRRHNLADAVAVFGLWNQKRVLSGYSQSSAQLRSDDGDTYLEVLPGAVNAAQNLNVENGASGSFVSADGHTVTVQNGIVTNIS